MIFHVDFVYLNETLVWLLQRKGAWMSQMEKNVSSVQGRPFPWLILPKSKEPCELWKPSWQCAGKAQVYKGFRAVRPSLGEEILSQLKARHLEMNLLLRREPSSSRVLGENP